MDKLEVKLLLICLKKLGANQYHDITGFFSKLKLSKEQIIDFLNSIQKDGYIRYYNKNQWDKSGWEDNPNYKPLFMAEITQPGILFLKSISDHKRSIATFILVIVLVLYLPLVFILLFSQKIV